MAIPTAQERNLRTVQIVPPSTKRYGLMQARIGSRQVVRTAEDARGVSIDVLDATSVKYRKVKSKPLCLNDLCVIHGTRETLDELEAAHPTQDRLIDAKQEHVFVMVGRERDKDGKEIGPVLYLSTEE